MIIVGCCGFPVSKAKYYEVFRVVELQSTFYKLPKVSTAEKWRQEAPSEFEFIVKAWQGITHPWGSPTWRRYGKTPPPGNLDNYGLLRYNEENCKAWQATVEICKALNCDKVLVQLPPRLKITSENIEDVKKFIRYMCQSDLTIIIEPRHESWNIPEIHEFFSKHNIVHCVDPFKDKPWGTGGFYYFRLHGINGYNYGYKYSDEDLRKLKAFIDGLPEKKEIYVMFNNKFMYDDAIQFMQLIQG